MKFTIDKILNWGANVLNDFDNVMFPEYKCFLCGREVEDLDIHLCKDCQKVFTCIVGNVCEICGEPLPEPSKICDECKTVDFNFDASRSAFTYNKTTAKLVTGLKFKNRKYLAKYLAGLMVNTLKDWGIAIDVLVPVPISEERAKSRGFNQSELLALQIGSDINVPVNNELVYRVKKTPNQKELTRKERMKNLIGAFAVKRTSEYKDKNILIIDDVFTTGSTLNEVARQIRKLMPNKVYCLTAAKTPLRKEQKVAKIN